MHRDALPTTFTPACITRPISATALALAAATLAIAAAGAVAAAALALAATTVATTNRRTLRGWLLASVGQPG